MTWVGEATNAPDTISFTLNINQNGTMLTGTFQSNESHTLGQVFQVSGTIVNGNIVFSVTMEGVIVTFSGTISGDSMNGTWSGSDSTSGNWSAHRG